MFDYRFPDLWICSCFSLSANMMSLWCCSQIIHTEYILIGWLRPSRFAAVRSLHTLLTCWGAFGGNLLQFKGVLQNNGFVMNPTAVGCPWESFNNVTTFGLPLLARLIRFIGLRTNDCAIVAWKFQMEISNTGIPFKSRIRIRINNPKCKVCFPVISGWCFMNFDTCISI